MSNRLKNENSPYLLQHAENPVDWYPWGKEAFDKAGRENKPIFLSIGYSTCHWCHVMAHESFENEEIAEILNRDFVSIKVDREERPDVDSVYMSVCQALTGSGGWPMSIFMTNQQKPFFAGTYFPPFSNGRMGFRELLLTIADLWKKRPDALLESAEQILEQIPAKSGKPDVEADRTLPGQAAELFSRSFDELYGGFGQAPKFPTPHNLIFLILYSQITKKENALEQAKITLEAMRRGGMFDQIGYGFSRYSTDRYFLVPHFEKMLYDNALLILAYAIAYKKTGSRSFLDTAKKTAEYVFREMTGADGEFFSAQDADSEGEEGRFYVWDYDEVCAVLGAERGSAFCEYFGMTKQGNFEGKNIPNLLNGNELSDAFDEERKILYDYRKNRAKLHLDDKILTSWNSLMICALAVLYRVTGEETYLLAAKRSQQFIEKNLANGNTLFVSCRGGMRSVKGFLDEYACYAAALLSLYDADLHPQYLERAGQICEEAEKQFLDRKSGGYFLYGRQNADLIIRPKETYDGALPSGNAVMAYVLVRMSQMKGGEDEREAAKRQLAYLSAQAKDDPAGHSVFLIALLLDLYPPAEITVVLSEEDRKEEIMLRLPLTAKIKMFPQESGAYRRLNGKTTYYVCKNQTCYPPTNEEPIF